MLIFEEERVNLLNDILEDLKDLDLREEKTANHNYDIYEGYYLFEAMKAINNLIKFYESEKR